MSSDGKTERMDESVNNKLAGGETDDVNSEVVPSLDSDKNSSDWNLPASLSKFRENTQRRKRPRRKSKKGKYPYSKSSWQQRRDLGSSERAQRIRQEMFDHGQPVAPYNTTQFLIEDHGDLQNIDAQLQVAQEQNPGSSLVNSKPSRARDSSFSIDSDVDYFYSSPEDEEEFLTKEFSNAYEDLHVERLSSMSKSEIIHDYLQLESKYEKTLIELKRLRKGADEGQEANTQQNKEHEGEQDRDTDTSSKSENEVAEQLRISQIENKSLKVELDELRKENKTLRSLVEKNDSSSVDSDSDSSSTSSITSDSSSSVSEMTDDKYQNVNGVTYNGHSMDDSTNEGHNSEAEK
ncbi:hypothetical protein RUM44_000784 [Polyplax serrata]|uniref:HEXIM n=1 Tax=Polyplax serrata TaxID=468196 RepID=A0ABR1B910_POLSC